MKKLSFVFVLFIVAFVSKSYAYLPNNPLDPQGTLINDGTCLAKWERAGDSLYYEITITTPSTFYDENSLTETMGDFQPFIKFEADGHDSVWYPGSMYITYDSGNYPYGTRTYCGVIDITGWDEWINVQADYYLYTGDPNNPVLSGDGLVNYYDLI